MSQILSDELRRKTRVNIGSASPLRSKLKNEKGLCGLLYQPDKYNSKAKVRATPTDQEV